MPYLPDLRGPISLCNRNISQPLHYWVKDVNNNTPISQWIITGGQLITSTSTTAEVLWNNSGVRSITAVATCSTTIYMQDCNCDGTAFWEAIDISDQTMTTNQIRAAIAPSTVPCLSPNQDCIRVENETILIRGELDLDHTAIEFFNCTLLVDKGGVIFTAGNPNPNRLAYFEQTVIKGICDYMWQGIKIGTEATLTLISSELCDAQYGITLNTKIHLLSLGSKYYKNYVSIYAPPSYNGNNIGSNSKIEGNDFNGMPLLVTGRYAGQTPLPEQNKTYSAFLLWNFGFLDPDLISTDPATLNYFHHLNNGIVMYDSDLNIYNCKFESIYKTANLYNSSSSFNGSAVYSRAHVTYSINLKVGDNNTGTDQYSNFFDKVDRSVYTDGTVNSEIINNTMDNNTLAIQIDRNRKTPTVLIKSNRINQTKFGIWCNLNRDTHINIEENIINNISGGLFRYGIRISDLAISPCTAYVAKNVIDNYSTIGILGENNRGSTYYSNWVTMHLSSQPASSDIFGIRLEGSTKNVVDCNLSQADMYVPNYDMKCLSLASSMQNTVSCNSVGLGRIGEQFVGDCTGTLFYGNAHYYHEDHILLGDLNTGASGVLSDQQFVPLTTNTPGNQFNGPYASHTKTVNYFNFPVILYANTYAPYLPFANTAVGGGSPFNIITPVDPPYSCPSCGDGGGGEGGEESFYESIVSNTSVPQAIDEELMKWQREKELYINLKSDSLLLDTNVTFQNFVDSVGSVNKGKFGEVFFELSVIESDSSGTLDSLNSLKLQSAEALNNSITPAAVFEETEKTVNDIIIKTILNDNWDFTPSQIATLQQIANQCPYTHGNAVFQARTLIRYLFAGTEFNDAALCSISLRKRKINNRQTLITSISPNPSSKSINISLAESINSGSTLTVFNSTMEKVLSKPVNSKDDLNNIDISNLAGGVYTILIEHVTYSMSLGKFIVIK